MSDTFRPDKRSFNDLREIKFEPGIAPHADGSVLVSFGDTRVICTAMIENKVPRWMQQQKVSGGWLTAEYSLLPYSTLDRKGRDISRGKIDGRTVEIQRLIGRSLRAVIDLQKMPGKTLWIDCDVLQADGGTRTASITGAAVAAGLAFQKLMNKKQLKENPLNELVAAVSVGVYLNNVILDLNYIEDKDATVDFNVVMTGSGKFVEVQGAGEEATFTQEQLTGLIDLGKEGIESIVTKQKKALNILG